MSRRDQQPTSLRKNLIPLKMDVSMQFTDSIRKWVASKVSSQDISSRLIKYGDKIALEDDKREEQIWSYLISDFLNSGFKIVENFILKFWNDEIKNTVKIEIDPKTKLQEYSLKYFKKLPIYKVLSCKGPQHNPSYKVSVKIHDSKFFYGTGNSKKIAEHNAARIIFKNLKTK